MFKVKKTITLINYILLSLIVLNLFSFLLFEISLNAQVNWIIKITYYISGIIAFFFNLKPYSKMSMYFSYFVISPFLAFLAWLLDGIFGALVISMFYFWLFPNMKVYSNDELIVYRPIGGLMGSCCNYEVYEKMSFLEKRIGKFQYDSSDELSSNGIKIIHKNNEVFVYKNGSILERISIK